MLYERHKAAPGPEAFTQIRLDTPNCSGRMDNLRAAILRPQLQKLDDNAERWNQRYDAFADALRRQGHTIQLPTRHPEAFEVPSSIQFRIPRFNEQQNLTFLANCASRGVDLKWFGAAEPKAYTSRYDSWRYIHPEPLPMTDRILSRLYDCRLPLTFSVEDCTVIGNIVTDVERAIV
jgi:dTDP-4-amino-4,6-dideoxygalactose transaminase